MIIIRKTRSDSTQNKSLMQNIKNLNDDSVSEKTS